MNPMLLSALLAVVLPQDTQPQTNPRPLRAARWSIVLPQKDPDAFLKKLQELQAYLLLPEGDSTTTFSLCDNLTQQPLSFRRVDKAAVNGLNRLWFISHDAAGREQVAAFLKLTATPQWFAIFIPPELEKEMVKQEVSFQKLSEEELFTKQFVTVFEVTRLGEVWGVKVTYQGPRKK
jgi:hypothetical protein